MRPRLATRPALLVAALALAGCGDDWQAKTFPASGSLTINGKPAPGALVQFIPQGAAPDARNSRPWGMVGADGTFELTTYEPGSGAPPGEYRVTITWPVDSTQPGSPDRLGGKFAAVEKSPATVTLKAEPNRIPPIELTKVTVVEKPRASGPANPNSQP